MASIDKSIKCVAYETDNRLTNCGSKAWTAQIGITPERSMGIAGSYDSDGKVLTIVTYNVQAAPIGFVNSMWEMQKEPFKGELSIRTTTVAGSGRTASTAIL